MLEYYKGDPKRINHFLKVYSFALIIGESEKISERKLYILSIAALVHDIGIKEAEKKYGSCNGKQQEIGHDQGDQVRNVQNADALVDHQVHDLQNFAHQQNKSQNKENDDEGKGNLPEYVAVDNFIHIAVSKNFEKTITHRQFYTRKT